jgi:hypothetical protein
MITDTLDLRNCHVHLSLKYPVWGFWRAMRVKMSAHYSAMDQLYSSLTFLRSKPEPGLTFHYG